MQRLELLDLKKALGEVLARDPVRTCEEADGAGFEPAKPFGCYPCTPNRQPSVFQYVRWVVMQKRDRRSDDQRFYGALPTELRRSEIAVAPVRLEPTTSGSLSMYSESAVDRVRCGGFESD